ncbi:restriction endonuclease subunit S, partial [Tepidicaulis marinus]|uniref:restriction endonuclease subunit S n=1 Tax=Tepidicaulis marinus TaxID=1333998 RepID=UPI0018CEDD0C
MAEWVTKRLGDLVCADRGISYGIVQPGDDCEDGIPIVRVTNLRGSYLDTTQPLKVSRDVESKYKRTRLRSGELLVSIVGTVGQTAIADERVIGWNVARAIAVIPVSRQIGAYWVRLCLQSKQALDHISTCLNTTVQATLNLRDLADVPIPIPPERERKVIAETLGALDDKIELNRRMNETLEAMAQALFKDWFVDFGPTRAKMEGRAPYLAPDLWSLFPDRLDEEGKPEGWGRETLGSLFDVS